jgi:hypothetical protein
VPDDPLSQLDARIAAVRALRASVARFSDAFWEADDTLAWLRTMRDELVRTGRVRHELRAYLESEERPVVRAGVDREPLLPLPTLVGATVADVKTETPIVAA